MARNLVVIALASIVIGCGSSPLRTGGSAGNGEAGKPGAGGNAGHGSGNAGTSGGADAGASAGTSGGAGAGANAGTSGHAGSGPSGGGAGGSTAGHAGGGAGGVMGAGGSAGPGGAAGSGNAGASGQPGSAGASGGRAGTGGSAGQGGTGGQGVARRLPLPCTAPLPTGFCLKSDPGDYIGGGGLYSASGSANVTLQSTSTSLIGGALTDPTSGGYWDFDFAAPAGALLIPGLYLQAQRYPFQTGSAPGLSLDGNGAGCNTLTGTFSIEELARDPTGLTRFSATFEQHCEGATPALHGVINYQATGVPDPTPTPDRVIPFSGKIFRVVYDPTTNIAYGLDATNRRLAKIDLTTGSATYTPVIQVPNDGCVDSARGRLFVVNKGSSLISEYRTDTLADVRDIAWTGTDYSPTETHFKIYCTSSTVYVVDGAWAPALFTVTGLDDTATPVVTDHTAQVAGVGGLAVNAAGTDLYTWYQYGWSAGQLNTYVSRLLTSDLSQIDQSATNLNDFDRDPLDAPLLLDEVDGYVLVKNKIFDALNLERIVYTLPGNVDTFSAADENAYALDAAHGLFATKNYVYDLSRFDILAPTVVPAADQLFFDSSGMLWMLSVSQGSLSGQIVQP
jgi:hypothetical protein